MRALSLAARNARLLRLGVVAAACAVFAAAAAPQSGSVPQKPKASGTKGIWITPAELRRIPAKGKAWSALVAAARADAGTADLGNQNSKHDVATLAAALVYAKTGTASYRAKAASGVLSAIGTESENTLALARGLGTYVIAADLIDLGSYDPAGDARFRTWLRDVRSRKLTDAPYRQTLIQTQELRPNNWGTHAGASRVAIAVYLGDRTDLLRAARVFRGWLGDRSAYSKFSYGQDLSWQHDDASPVGVNPPASMKDGHSIDGAQPEEMRRGGKFRWPPKKTGYPWEALQGAVVEAEILHRRGLRAWEWQDQALRRAVVFLYELSREVPDGEWWASGDDTWVPWIINARYGPLFPTVSATQPGKNMGWTDWTHSRPATSTARPPA